jgi:hypothetical protein
MCAPKGDSCGEVSDSLSGPSRRRVFSARDPGTWPCKGTWQKFASPLTGVRVSDADTDKTKAGETRAVLEDIPRSHPTLGTR